MTGGQRRWKNNRENLNTLIIVHSLCVHSLCVHSGFNQFASWGGSMGGGAGVEHGVELPGMICTMYLHISLNWSGRK